MGRLPWLAALFLRAFFLRDFFAMVVTLIRRVLPGAPGLARDWMADLRGARLTSVRHTAKILRLGLTGGP